jgi:hypothetical protein
VARTVDHLRAKMAQTLGEFFPEASPTVIGLAVIALRDDVWDYVRGLLAANADNATTLIDTIF